jgi:DNA (cytosine-5)-methyltransferase 1
MNVWYNDNDPYCALWLRNLIAGGHLRGGAVDDRDVLAVDPADIAGYGQCHFFAGLGGWPHALDLAGWGERPVWTFSCPCQPLSSAGARREHADRRHLWPALYRLVAECRPAICFGEQVASKAGREWLAAVRADLEHLGYAVGAADLPAACVGAPHIRQRLWFVADARGGPLRHLEQRVSGRRAARVCDERQAVARDDGAAPAVADADRERRGCVGLAQHGGVGRSFGDFPDGCGEGGRRDGPDPVPDAHEQPMGRSSESWRERNRWAAEPGLGWGSHGLSAGMVERGARDGFETAWADGWEDGIPRTAIGVAGRVGQLRAYGNAIVPQVGQAFVGAWLEVERGG